MTLQRLPMPLYASRAGAKSSAGIDSPNTSRRTSALLDGACFASPLWVAVRGSLRAAGFLECRSVNPRTVAHPSIDSEPGDSSTLGVTPMKLFPTRNPSARAAAHRAMAKSALFSDSSAAVRLKRYNHHIEKARALEAEQVHIRRSRLMQAYDTLRAENAEVSQ